MACSDAVNTLVMSLMYLSVKQSSSYSIGTRWRCESRMEVTPSLDGSGKYWDLRSLREMLIVPSTHTMFASIIIWFQGAPLWMCLRLLEHLQPLLKCDHDAVITLLTDWVCMHQPHSHRYCAPKADSNSTHIANNTMYVYVPYCAVITPENVPGFNSKETEPDAVNNPGSAKKCLTP